MTSILHPCVDQTTLTWRRVVGPVLLSAWAAATAADAQWVELGPAPITSGDYTGRVSAIVCSPTDFNRYFAAGADGGVWRTDDGGVSWEALTDDLPTTAIGALAIDRNDESVIYAGTGEANFANHSRYGLGIYKTTDGGDHWSHYAQATFAGRCISRIVVNPIDSQVLYASVTPAGGFPALAAARGHPQATGPFGVFKSTDGGVNWTHLTNGVPAVAATDLAIDPVSPQTLYAAIGDIFGDSRNGIYKSTNAGENWVKLSGGLPTSGVGRVSLAIAPTDPEVLYTIYVRNADASGGGASTRNVYRTDNGGASWSPLDPGNFQASYGWYLSVAVVDPKDEDIVFVGGLSLLRSTSGGASWQDVTPPHVDMHALAWDAAGRLVVGDDGGVHRTANLGAAWTSQNGNLGCIQFYAGLSLSPAGPDYLYGGTQDNGTNYRATGGVTWSNILGGDGGYTGVRPDHPNYVFCEWQGSANLYRSTSFGPGPGYSGWGISGSDRHCFLPPFAINPDNDEWMLYGTHRVYVSSDAGASWGVRSGDLTTGQGAIRCLVLAPSDPLTVYVVTNDGNVQISADFGNTWTLSLTGVPGWPRTTRQVAVDPDDDSRAVLAVSNFGVDQVLMTEDRGDNWFSIDGDLPDIPVNTAAIESRPLQDVIYLGTDAGVYRSINGAVNWTRLGNNLPNVPVIDLIVDPVNGRLVAGTQGRGAWQIPISHVADFDGDNDVDLTDYSSFEQCLAGPGASPPAFIRAVCLDTFDTDADGDVDLVDFGAFQILFTGPLLRDCNGNGVADECDTDCAWSGARCPSPDCGTSLDCNTNGVPDECEADCNTNGPADPCDVQDAVSADCNGDEVPDECQLASNDCDDNGVPDDCQSAALITLQPEDDGSCPMAEAVLSVSAAGTGLQFQWRKGGEPLVDGDGVEGVATATLVIASFDQQDEGIYTCEVSAGCIVAVSDPATLTLNEPTSIADQPGSLLRRCAGLIAWFTVTANGTPPIVYEWSRDGIPLADGERISGATTASLLISDISIEDAGMYACRVSNACGFADSDPSGLEVVEATFMSVPQDTCAEPGETIALTAQAVASPPQPVGYRWKKDGHLLSDGGRISGALTETLMISDIADADAGSYSALAYTIDPVCFTGSPEAVVAVGDCINDG